MHSSGKGYQVLAFLLVYFVISPFSVTTAFSRAYYLSWNLHKDNLELDTDYIDFQHNTVLNFPFIFSRSYSFTDRFFQFSFLGQNLLSVINVIQVPFTSLDLLESDIVVTTFRESSNSLLFASEFIGLDAGQIWDIRFFSATNMDFVTDSIPLPGTELYQVIDMEYNPNRDQLLLLSNLNGNVRSLVFDFPSRSWTEASFPIEDGLELDPSIDRGELALNIAGDQAIYYNSALGSSDTDSISLTYLFDFNSGTWQSLKSKQIPTFLRNYQIEYLPGINRYILFGGTGFGMTNRNVWVFSPRTLQWSLMYSNFPMMNEIWPIDSYYNPNTDLITIVGVDPDTSFDFSIYLDIMTMNVTVEEEGYLIDIGLPLQNVLWAFFGTIGLGFLIAVVYLIRYRPSLFRFGDSGAN